MDNCLSFLLNLLDKAFVSKALTPFINLVHAMKLCSLDKILRCDKSNFIAGVSNKSLPDTLKWVRCIFDIALLILSASAFELTIIAVVSSLFFRCSSFACATILIISSSIVFL